MAHNDRLTFIKSTGPGETDFLAAIATTIKLLRWVDHLVYAGARVFVLDVMDDNDGWRRRALTQYTVR